jgi:hypothetical protein
MLTNLQTFQISFKNIEPKLDEHSRNNMLFNYATVSHYIFFTKSQFMQLQKNNKVTYELEMHRKRVPYLTIALHMTQ